MKVIPKSIHHLLDDSKGGIKKSYLEENYYDKDYIDDNFVSEADVSNFVTIQGPLQTVLGEKKLKNISLLNIPGTAPSSSDIDSGKSYLYSSYGSYAEVPGGGGGGGGETLTILRNGTQVATYNGSTPVSANILVPTTVASLSDASDYATKTWVENKGYITSAALSGYVTIATDQEITGAKYFSNALAIPLSAPSSPTSGLSYLYAGSGSYAEEPGGGVADVYPLTITKNGSSWLYYDPGEEAVSVNLSVPTKVSDLTNDTGFITSSALTGYATQTWVENKGYITSSALTGYVNDFEVTGSGNAVTEGSKSGSKITLTKGNTFVDLTSEQKITGAKKHANVALLNIPTSISSSDIESGKVYLYSGSGEYAEEASGGVADVYPLYLVIGGTTTTYDPASESTTVTFGSAAKKGYTTSITQGSADLPTSGAVYSAIAAAVTSALHYRGMSSTALTDGGTETAIIGGVALVPQSGDVVIYGGFEFLWENSVWNKLGDDSSYALKTVQISAGTGLSGGGDLTSSRTISLSSATIASLGLADSALQSSDMKALTLKVGTATIGSDYNALAAKTYTISKTNITDTIGSTTYAPYNASGYLPLSAGSSKPLTDDLYFTKTIYGADVQVGRIGSVIDGGIVTYFTNPSSGSGSGTGPGFAIINTPYEKLLFWRGSTDDSLEIYHEGNLTKGVLTTLLESNNGYYVKKSGDTMTGTLNSQSIIPTSNTSYDLGSSSSKWNNIYTRAIYAAVAKISDLLSIPTVAPASGSIVSGEAYLYSSTGSYAETPGGGVADVYPLTITKNGSAWLYYNPGTQAESINLAIPTKVSDLTNDTGFITASSIPSTYAWSAITNTPTTLSGYGITDAKIETPSGTSNRKITLGSNNFTIYSWALASAKPSYTLDEVADGSTRKLANYLPLAGNAVASKITGNVILGNNVFLQGVHTNGTDVRELIGLDNNNIVTVGCSTNQLRLITSSVDIKHNKNGTLYSVYDESNLTKSVLTGLLDANNGYYLPLSGGTMSNTNLVTNMNADLLDGEQGSYYNNFLTYYNGATPTANGITYPLALVQKGTPTGAWWYVTTMYYSAIGSNFYSQIATSYNATIPDMYIRQTYNGTATSWYKLYHDGNLTKSVLTTLLDSNSGYYLPLTAGSSKALTGDLYLNASSAEKSIYMTDASNNAHQVATLTTAGNLTIGNNQPTRGGMTVIRGATVMLSTGDTTTNEKYTIGFFGSNGQFYPSPDNTVVSGTAAKRWKAIYAVNLYGNLALSYLQNADDLKAIEALTGTGLAKRTADNTWVLKDSSLLDTSTESDATFTYRAVPSVAVGDVARATKVKGKTIVWNQLINAASVSYTNLGLTITAVNGHYTISGTASGNGGFALLPRINTVAGHKYFVHLVGTHNFSSANWRGVDMSTMHSIVFTETVNTSNVNLQINVTSGQSYSADYWYYVCDLTLMFGAGNEPSTAAEFEALYPLPYYSYNPGELISNKTESIETIGFNLWDEETVIGLYSNGVLNTAFTSYLSSKNKTRIFPNTTYYFHIGSNANVGRNFVYYDASGNYISDSANIYTDGAITTPANAHYVNFSLGAAYGTTYRNDICINLSDTSRNGTYEPYRKDTLPLNITKLKVDTTNLWDEQWEQGTLDTNGADYASTINIRNKGYIQVEGGKTYYVKGNIQIYEYGASKNYITRTFLNSGTITLNVNTCYLRWRSADNYTYTEGDIWINTPTKRPPLKLNQLADNFVAYNSASITTSGTNITVSNTNSNAVMQIVTGNSLPMVKGHKYIFYNYVAQIVPATISSIQTVVYNGSVQQRPYTNLVFTYTGATDTCTVIWQFTRTDTSHPTSFTIPIPNIYDLTAMYGAGLEPTSVAEVEELVGNYHPYTTGEDMPNYIFPKGLKGAGTAYDEASGKRAIKRIGVVDLGTLNWEFYTTDTTNHTFKAAYTGMKAGDEAVVANCRCSKYYTGKFSYLGYWQSLDKVIAITGNAAPIFIRDTAYSDVATFKTAMAGVKLYYELATPIEYDLETAVPELIECDVLGTQRRLPEDTASSVQAPFHCDFQYGANPGEIVSDSAYRYLPLAGGTVYGTLEASGELIIPDHAPYQPEPNKHYLYVNDNGNYYQS